MKIIAAAVVLLFFTSHLLAQDKKQPNIKYDTDYFKALDHWVVLPESNTNLLGYIYVDPANGFTFALHAKIISLSPQWILAPENKQIITKLLDKNTPLVRLLSAKVIRELQLPAKPKWLQITTGYEEVLAQGSHYNAIGQPALAIPFFEDAYRLSQEAAFELACSYNATNQYDKAITFLQNVLKKDFKNYMLYRELGFALIQCERVDEAELVYEKGFPFCANDLQRRTMAIDMAHTFYRLQRQEQFVKWSVLLKKYDSEEGKIVRSKDPVEDWNED